MAEHGFRRIPLGIQAMGMGSVPCPTEDVSEKLLAQGLEQILLRLKVRIESGTAYVGRVNNFLYGDLAVALFRQEPAEGVESSRSGLLLPSVHGCSFRTNLQKCFIKYSAAKSSLARMAAPFYNKKEQYVR